MSTDCKQAAHSSTRHTHKDGDMVQLYTTRHFGIAHAGGVERRPESEDVVIFPGECPCIDEVSLGTVVCQGEFGYFGPVLDMPVSGANLHASSAHCVADAVLEVKVGV